MITIPAATVTAVRADLAAYTLTVTLKTHFGADSMDLGAALASAMLAERPLRVTLAPLQFELPGFTRTVELAATPQLADEPQVKAAYSAANVGPTRRGAPRPINIDDDGVFDPLAVPPVQP